MTRRTGWRAQVARLDAAELAPASHPRLLFALAAVTVAHPGGELELARYDALQLCGPAR